jgi:hypothetical protein
MRGFLSLTLSFGEVVFLFEDFITGKKGAGATRSREDLLDGSDWVSDCSLMLMICPVPASLPNSPFALLASCVPIKSSLVGSHCVPLSIQYAQESVPSLCTHFRWFW